MPSLPNAPVATGRKVYDVKAGKMRLAAENGQLQPLPTIEQLIPKFNDLLVLAGAESLPGDTDEETLMPRLQEAIDALAERDRAAKQEADSKDVAAAAMVDELRTLCGLPRASAGSTLADSLVGPIRVVRSVPVVAARGKLLTTQGRHR